MKLGSSRWGNDFETKSREFLAKYGFEIISENEVITCTNSNHRKKGKKHEVDIISQFSFPGHPLPPLYGPQINEKFLMSAKGGFQCSKEDIKDAQQQLECLRKNPKFTEVSKTLIICEHSTANYPSGNTFLWDEKFMHLLAMKMRVFSITKNGFAFNHFNDQSAKSSLMLNVTTSNNFINGNLERNLHLYIFKEDPVESIGKKDVINIVTKLSKTSHYINELNKIINIFSPSGFKTDLLALRGKIAPENPNLYFNSFSDLSIATWAPSLENDTIF